MLSKTETPTRAKLSQLSIDAVNVRKTGRGAEPEFAASIRAKGLLESLIVRRSSQDGYTITNGSKRFDALLYLKQKGEKANGIPVDDDYEVPITIREESDAEARETSLMANIIRRDMHPVDEFEAFAQMIQDGATVDDLAKRYIRKPAEIRQALSLAAIAPEIRKAWREGKIDGDAAEAYAQTRDLQHQVRIFNKLKGGRAGEKWSIAQELFGARYGGISKLLKFVGQKEYEAAGHQVNTSLFDDDDRHSITVNNVPALKAMAAAKIEAECERLKKDGWGWAIPKEDAPNDIYAWRRLPPSPTKEQKAHAGCTIDIGYSGAFEIERGYTKPGDKIKIEKSPAQKKKARAAKEESGGISNTLATRLSRQITFAAADALSFEGPLALRIAIAAIASGSAPARIEIHGMPELDGEGRFDNDFDKYFALTAKKAQDELLKMLAIWVAKSLNMTCGHPSSLPLTGEGVEGEALVLNSLNPKTLNAALRKRFDAKDYFESVNKELCLKAIEEAMPAITVNKTLPKAKIAAIAVANVPKTGWLPAELRTARYDGPSAKAAAKSTKAKAKPRR